MPPVFGPWSPSRARLKSCAGRRGTVVVPSASANRETSGPSRYSSITTLPQAAACFLAAARSSVTTTPLPAARASSFTTYGGPKAARASSASASVVAIRQLAVGMPASAMMSLAKAFEPSMRAAAASGPKAARPSARRASATPATSGASGPITTRSVFSALASRVTSAGLAAVTWWTCASSAMPGLPGAACSAVTAGSRRSARTIACSRPPEPITSTRTGTIFQDHGSWVANSAGFDPRSWAGLEKGTELQGLVAARADADRADRGTGEVLDRLDVMLRGRGQVSERSGLRDVLPPPVEVLVDRLGVMELGLRHRDVVVALAVDFVGHAYRHLAEAGQHVELGDEEVGDPVDPGGIPCDDGVEPAGAPRAARGHAVLAAGLAQVLALLVEEFGGEGAGADPRGVCLDEADHLGDPGRADARADARAARRGRGRGDERVRTVVHVKHGRLRALKQNVLVAVQRPGQDQAGVGHVRLQPLAVADVLFGGLVRVDASAVVDLGEQLVLVPQDEVELLTEDAGIEQVLDPDAQPGHFVAICRPDAAAGGADPGVAEKPLADFVQRPVMRHDQVRVRADQELFAAYAALFQGVDLLEEHAGIDDDAVADDGRDVRGEHPGRQHVQRVALVADDDGVAGVIAALVPDDVLHAVPEQVGRLALTLVAPLGADQHDGGHLLTPFTRRNPWQRKRDRGSCVQRLPEGPT